MILVVFMYMHAVLMLHLIACRLHILVFVVIAEMRLVIKGNCMIKSQV